MNQEKIKCIQEIVRMEWEQFQQVNNEGGRANCQDDWPTFHVMRQSQFAPWPQDALASYLADLRDAEREGRNLVMEKYARMMASTCPERYREIETYLPEIPTGQREKVEQIVDIHKEWMAEHAEKYPNLARRGRVLYTEEDTPWDTSAETYLRGELLTYSGETVQRYLEFVQKCKREGENLVILTDSYTVQAYGYESLEEAEKENR